MFNARSNYYSSSSVSKSLWSWLWFSSTKSSTRQSCSKMYMIIMSKILLDSSTHFLTKVQSRWLSLRQIYWWCDFWSYVIHNARNYYQIIIDRPCNCGRATAEFAVFPKRLPKLPFSSNHKHNTSRAVHRSLLALHELLSTTAQGQSTLQKEGLWTCRCHSMRRWSDGIVSCLSHCLRDISLHVQHLK